MRASGASELRKFWHFYILKLLFLSIFCRYKWHACRSTCTDMHMTWFLVTYFFFRISSDLRIKTFRVPTAFFSSSFLLNSLQLSADYHYGNRSIKHRLLLQNPPTEWFPPDYMANWGGGGRGPRPPPPPLCTPLPTEEKTIMYTQQKKESGHFFNSNYIIY